jgi:hypothetical protein
MGSSPSQDPDVIQQDPNRDFSYAAPGSTGGPMQTMGASQPPPPPSLWDKLQDAIGQGGLPKTQMPGTTFGAAAQPPMMSQGQMPTPRGMGAYFNAIQNPAASGGNLMARYAALQQLMRGS